jgi:PadR family transcriptional regulator PadR
MAAEELAAHLDALLLAAVEDGPRHCYAIIEPLAQATGGRLDLPTGRSIPSCRARSRPG